MVNADVYMQRQSPNLLKARYYQKDLRDWARFAGIEINTPSVFPVKSVTAMRGCFYALEQNLLVPYAQALFEAYWRDDRDISLDSEICACAVKAGLNPDALLSAAKSPEAKAALLANTEDLIARQGFGSPTFYVNGDDMYFGNDRLDLVEAAISRAIHGEAVTS